MRCLSDVGLKPAYSLASQLLCEEVEALHAAARQLTAAQGEGDGGDGGGGGGIRGVLGSEAALEGRLRLVAALLKELGCAAAVGLPGGGGGARGAGRPGLIHTLLTR